MLTNQGLVVYAKKALAEKWGYVWGTFGQMLTTDLLMQKERQYPEGVGNYLGFIKSNWLGRKVTDCVGLIKGYYWSESGVLKYSGVTDVNADKMFSLATEKGSIASIPNLEGVCVWRKGHIGVYIGNGQVIEAKGTKYGVKQTALKSGTWTHWLKCPYIDYKSEPKVVITSTYKTVTATELNVRTGAGLSYNIIGTLKKGEKVKIGRVLNNGWTNIYFGNHGGFVSSKYLK